MDFGKNEKNLLAVINLAKLGTSDIPADIRRVWGKRKGRRHGGDHKPFGDRGF